MNALPDFQSNSTVNLAPGAYGVLKLHGLDNLTVLANGASITGLDVQDCGSLVFKGLELDLFAKGRAQVLRSVGVHFHHMHIHGGVDTDPSAWPPGLRVVQSTKVLVSRSTLDHLGLFAISAVDCTNVRVAQSSFHDIAVDGFHATGALNVQILDNVFEGFFMVPGPDGNLSHSDAIQFFVNSARANHGLTVSGNLILGATRGTGMQGLHIKDESGVLPASSITISDNLIVGTSTNGLQVGEASVVHITNNVVLALPPIESTKVFTNAGIRLRNLSAYTLDNNRATFFSIDDVPAHALGVALVPMPTPDQAQAFVEQWRLAHALVPG